MSARAAVSAPEPGAASVPYRPMYARVLGLRHLKPGGILCFVYFEGSIALALLLALAELASWWVVLILPVSIALMVKVNDMVAGAAARSAARSPDRDRERLRREVLAFTPKVGRAKVPARLGEAVSHREAALDRADASPRMTPQAAAAWQGEPGRSSAGAAPRAWQANSTVPEQTTASAKPRVPGRLGAGTTPVDRTSGTAPAEPAIWQAVTPLQSPHIGTASPAGPRPDTTTSTAAAGDSWRHPCLTQATVQQPALSAREDGGLRDAAAAGWRDTVEQYADIEAWRQRTYATTRHHPGRTDGA